MTDHDRPAPIGNRRIFWACVAVGWVLIAAGIRGVVIDARFTRPPQWSAWFVGAAIFHDFLVAPVVFALAAGPLRRLRRPYRAAVQAGLVLTALVTVVSLPVLLRPGEPTGNPTVLPERAAGPLAVLVGGIWVLALAGIALARRRMRRPPPPDDIAE